jgi:AmmeMemoRadiSam system protein A
MLPIGIPERRYALRIVRQSLIDFLGRGAVAEHHTTQPSLLQLRGAFVTLRRRHSGELRGCRGEYRPVRPLIESVIRHAISSATDDPRFACVVEEEIPTLSIRISALSALRRIRPDEVVLGRHGLVVVQGGRSGLLLPEVPRLFGLRTPAEFLRALHRKAGLVIERTAQSASELYCFETEAWGDDDFHESDL